MCLLVIWISYRTYMVPNGATVLDSSFFLFKGLNKSLQDAPKGVHVKLTKANQVVFPAIEGQSVSYTVFQYAPKGVNAPHTHPCSAKLFLVLQGSLNVGFVDSNKKLFVQSLQTGNMFLFPKGKVHFQANMDTKHPAVAISAFGSTINLPRTLFGSGIDIALLVKSFKTDVPTIQELVLDDYCNDYGGG
ncbi:putative germin, rmlC-like cupin domain superfamily, rmlC-like jelly roll [Dioscorea sansibarensis]